VLGELIQKGCILLHSSNIILNWRSPKSGHDSSDYCECVLSGNGVMRFLFTFLRLILRLCLTWIRFSWLNSVSYTLYSAAFVIFLSCDFEFYVA